MGKKSRVEPNFTVKEILEGARLFGVDLPCGSNELRNFLLFASTLYSKGAVDGFQSAIEIFESKREPTKSKPN